MYARIAAFAAALVFATAAESAEVVLVTPTGETVGCAEVAAVRLTDMPRLFALRNFDQAHEGYVRFRVTAPSICARAARSSGLARVEITREDLRLAGR